MVTKSSSPGPELGILFFDGKLSEAKAIAQKEGKMLFIDCYTSWCAPCKKMSKEVFTQKDVGAHFNEHFINYKLDMETKEGIALSKDYQVQFYPTLLFITPEGELVRKEIGYHSKKQLLSLAKTIKSPEKSR